MAAFTRCAVFYHADCLDGFGAAYSAWAKFGDRAVYRPLHHGEDWQIEEVADRDVYILDFSFPPDVLEAMARAARSVTQIDHHVSARQPWHERLTAEPNGCESYRHPSLPLHVIFDMERSGSRLAWGFFHPQQETPLAIRHIEDMDLWRFALPGTRAFCRTLRLAPFDFSGWTAIFAATQSADSATYRQMLAQGEAIEQFLNTEIHRLAGGNLVTAARLRGEPVDALQAVRHGQEIISDGIQAWQVVRGPAINASALFASELGNLLAEKSESFGLIWQLSPQGDARVSLRSKGDFDVAAIAQRYGGGGHRNAAGFRMPVHDFLDEVLNLHAIKPNS